MKNAQELKKFVVRNAMENFERLPMQERAALLEGIALILESGPEALAADVAARCILDAEQKQMTFQTMMRGSE